jgi:hypothetical protein
MSVILKYCLLFILSHYGTNQMAKPRVVSLDYELAHSTFTGLVIVNDYDSNGNIKFSSLEFKDTTNIAFVDANFTDRNFYSNPKLFLTASLPSKGDTVLIVLDSTKDVSLFAKQTGNYYRFWSPWITGSEALFSFSPPAIAIDKACESEGASKHYSMCWDGCLLPINDLRSYIKNSYKKDIE